MQIRKKHVSRDADGHRLTRVPPLGEDDKSIAISYADVASADNCTFVVSTYLHEMPVSALLTRS
jgi:hypothetical protein